MSLLQQFIKQSPKHIQEQEQAKAKEAKIEAKIKEYEATLEKQREANKTQEEVPEVNEHLFCTNYLEQLDLEDMLQTSLSKDEIDLIDELLKL